MCYKGKCMHCLEVETGALIFAIFNVMLTSLGSVFSIGGLVYTSLFMDEIIKDSGVARGDEDKAMVIGLASNVVFTVLAVGFCISFSFAVVLIVGLCKRKPGLVKCYFVYGVTKMVCGVAVMIMMAMNMSMVLIASPIIMLAFVMNFVYGLILFMVRMTYKKFESELVYNSFSNPMATIQKF